MNTKTLIAIVVIALVVLGAYFFFSNRAAAPEVSEEAPAATSGQTEQTSEDTAYDSLVTYTDGGFSPSTATVKVGDTVRFTNNSGSALWVGADEHPTHTSYDGTATSEHCASGAATGGSFDMCHRGVPGETWDYTFTKAGSFDYHNHAQASHGGTVVVE